MALGTVTCSFNPQPVWSDFSTGTQIGDGIHIWHGKVADFQSVQAQLHTLLNGHEREVAAKFYRASDCERYIIQHGLLTLLLRWYLHDDELQPSYIYNPNKKPFLANRFDCYFNLSNTGDEFLIAIGNKSLGVDIEKVNLNFGYTDVAAFYFGAEELAFINQSENPRHAFFLLWTRKEALLKACGSGIDDYLPLIPALDSIHTLPSHFNNGNWVTESFGADSGAMISVTQGAAGEKVCLWRLNANGIELK